MEKEIVCKKFYELTLDELYAILKWRSSVFIVEQNCVYQDVDDMDQDALHMWMKVDGKTVAYLRILKANTYLDEIAIGRVITLERSKGYGLELFRRAMEEAKKRLGATRIKLRSQLQAAGFYEKSGFKPCGEPFMHEGLMHVDMMWEE